ncbi:alpha/beta fold hydrolase [Pseudomonas saliphila]|uniref:alpha/beta fold hydrolase n=1 Tax=Pseudomonas saliphila TaxID=2586906 RepID=UPI001F1F2D0D|nr:alpha/beta hydrolase [Pseudomonas saliphila]
MASIKHAYVHTNGIRMHYVEQGQGPLVVLLHGWPESWYSWRHQITALADAGYRVIAPDQRGYGYTEAPAEISDYGIFNLVGDVVGLVNALGEEQAAIVGHDMGSIVTSAAALLRPDMFTQVGLLSVPFMQRKPIRPAVRYELASQKTHFYQAYFQAPGRAEAELEEDVRRSILGVLHDGSAEARLSTSGPETNMVFFDKNTRLVDNLVTPDELPAWLTEHDLSVFTEHFTHSGFRGGINWYRNMDQNWAQTPFWDGARITQPLLYIAGALDGVLKITGEDIDAMKRTAPRLQGKHLIENAGHWVQQERPEEVSRLLIKFLESPRTARSS